MMLVFVLAVLFVTATAAPSDTPDTDHDTAKEEEGADGVYNIVAGGKEDGGACRNGYHKLVMQDMVICVPDKINEAESLHTLSLQVQDFLCSEEEALFCPDVGPCRCVRGLQRDPAQFQAQISEPGCPPGTRSVTHSGVDFCLPV